MHKMTITVCFNLIGATEAELDVALSDLLFPVFRDDHTFHYRTPDLTIIVDSDSCYYYLYDRSI